MDDLVNKIKTIQNKQRTLRWGHYQMSDTEIMFAVGNTAYPKEPQFFVITANFELFLLNKQHKKYIYNTYSNNTEVVKGVIELLKGWFPAKQL